MSPISRLMSPITRRVSTISVDVSGVSGAETRVHTPTPGESEAQNGLPDSIISSAISGTDSVGSTQSIPRPSIGLAVELSLTSYLEPRVEKHYLLRGGILVLRISSLRSIGGGMCRGDGGSGGDGNAAGVVHLARRSPIEGGDSEASGDGDGVGMARSLSTSAYSGKDMAD
nr:hypothetical protein [Tanacetum cinerariifolium]